MTFFGWKRSLSTALLGQLPTALWRVESSAYELGCKQSCMRNVNSIERHWWDIDGSIACQIDRPCLQDVVSAAGRRWRRRSIGMLVKRRSGLVAFAISSRSIRSDLQRSMKRCNRSNDASVRRSLQKIQSLLQRSIGHHASHRRMRANCRSKIGGSPRLGRWSLVRS